MSRNTLKTALTAWLACITCLAGCAVDDAVAPERPGYGTLELALSGSLPNAKKMSIRLFRGALDKPGKVPAHAWACQNYGGTSSNKSVVQDLEAHADYSVLVELFEDDACTKLRYRAYRGNIAVKAGTGKEVSSTPYWLPTVELGHFTAMAQVNSDLNKKAATQLCATDDDCHGIHVNAVCAENHRCRVDHLFPLNGAQRRGFPTTVSLGDGRVAVVGGLSVLSEGYWTATAEIAEIYDPTTGIFTRTKVSGSMALGMADAVTLTGSSFAYAGGTSGAKLTLAKQKLSTQLDTRLCLGGAADCAVNHELFRWNLTGTPNADALTLGVPVAFPQVAQVVTPAGSRLLVAGGADVPVLGDKRRGKSQLCSMDTAGITCPEQAGATMKAARAQAAVGCLGRDAQGQCTKVGLFGGRVSGPLSEVYDGTAGTFTALSDLGQPPPAIHGGKLYPFGPNTYLLVGSSAKKLFLEDAETTTGGDRPVYRLAVDANLTSVTWTTVDLSASGAADGGQRLWPASVQLNDGSVLLIGGLDPQLQPIGDAIWIAKSGSARIPLNFARFGASASLVGGQGPMAGCVLLSGGFGAAEDGSALPLNQVELFCL